MVTNTMDHEQIVNGCWSTHVSSDDPEWPWKADSSRQIFPTSAHMLIWYGSYRQWEVTSYLPVQLNVVKHCPVSR